MLTSQLDGLYFHHLHQQHPNGPQARQYPNRVKLRRIQSIIKEQCNDY